MSMLPALRARGRAFLIILLLVAPTFLALVPGPAGAELIVANQGTLAQAAEGGSAVWLGDRAYLIGGEGTKIIGSSNSQEVVQSSPVHGGTWCTETLRTIADYDPGTQTSVLRAGLPGSVSGAAAVALDGAIYIFGGWTCDSWFQGRRDWILKYDPVTDTVTKMNAVLPNARNHVAATTDGQNIFLFGGLTNYGASRMILHYDPRLDMIVQVGELPTATWRASAVWSNGYAYLFGGDGTGDQILRIDPKYPASVTVMPTKLPTTWNVQGIAIAANDHVYYSGCYDTNIFRYNLSTGALSILPERLPASCPTSAFDGMTAYIFYGTSVARFLPSPDPVLGPPMVRNLTAARGPGLLEVTLQWEPPAAGAPLTAYRVYRGTSASTLQLAAVLDPAEASYLETNVTENTRFFYQVRPVNASGEGDPGATFSLTTHGRPSAPTGIEGARVGDEVHMMWKAPATTGHLPLAGYRIYRVLPGASPELLASTTALQFTDPAAPTDTVPLYRVVAHNVLGEGPAAELEGVTKAAPTAPTHLQALRGPGRGQISLSWAPPTSTDGLTLLKYRVYHRPGGIDTLLGETTGRTFLASGLMDGEYREYRVSAVTLAGEGNLTAPRGSSAPIAPSAPTNLEASSQFGRVDVRWTPTSDTGGVPLSFYVLQRANVGGSFRTLDIVYGNYYPDRSASIGGLYTYRLAAVNVVGYSTWSNTATAAGSAVPPIPRETAVAPGTFQGPFPFLDEVLP